MDQYHRTYLLRIIGNYSGIRKIEFPCYYSWTFYVSEEEQNLIKAAFEKLEKLTFVKLPNVANIEIIQVNAIIIVRFLLWGIKMGQILGLFILIIYQKFPLKNVS